jgi:hypothetical protein
MMPKSSPGKSIVPTNRDSRLMAVRKGSAWLTFGSSGSINPHKP